MDLIRPVLFTRALARVATDHEAVATNYTKYATYARIFGEFIALLALVHLAERQGFRRPYQMLLAIFFAFFLPSILLTEGSLAHAQAMLFPDGKRTFGSHLVVGSLGVFLCYAVYEGLIALMDDYRIGEKKADTEEE